jgi:hypothetical protein
MGKGLSFGWPVCSVLDEIKSFDGEIEAGCYYIAIYNFVHSRGLGGMMLIWFLMHMNVNYLYKKKYISMISLQHFYLFPLLLLLHLLFLISLNVSFF